MGGDDVGGPRVAEIVEGDHGLDESSDEAACAVVEVVQWCEFVGACAEDSVFVLEVGDACAEAAFVVAAWGEFFSLLGWPFGLFAHSYPC